MPNSHQIHIMENINPYIKNIGFTKREWEDVELLFYLSPFNKENLPSATIEALGDFLKSYLKTKSHLPIGYLSTIFNSYNLRQNLLQLLLYVKQHREEL